MLTQTFFDLMIAKVKSLEDRAYRRGYEAGRLVANQESTANKPQHVDEALAALEREPGHEKAG